MEKDPNEVYYFATKKHLREEAEVWIDDLADLLLHQFSAEEMDSVTTDAHPTRSYRAVPTAHTNEAVSVYNTILADMMMEDKPTIVNTSETAAVVEEDILEKCWKAPPRSVYSTSETSKTHASTVSGITESPGKSITSPRDDAAWATLVDRTAALEKAAENLVISGKQHQENSERVRVAAAQQHSVDLIKLKEQNETYTRDMITAKFDQLLKESEDIKAKNIEMVEWRTKFDEEQKQRLREHEKKISKKIDARISDLSTDINTQLQEHREQADLRAKEADDRMTSTFDRIISIMSNFTTTSAKHTILFDSIQDYSTKEKVKRQKHSDEDIDLDSDMEEADTLREENRDALAPDKVGQGGT